MGTYAHPLLLTQQFRFCGNAFRIDTYKGCDFGCKYCFANSSQFRGREGYSEANIESIEKLFHIAFDTDEIPNSREYKLTVELLRRKVPLHCGGMADPFQTREWELHLTYKLIELSNKYNYPICFSTKTDTLPSTYFDILNPKIHAFQISMLGYDDEFVRKYETNTPTVKSRIKFLKLLRNKGFWCSVRIQPLIDIEQTLKLVDNLKEYPSYITVEHLKIPMDNPVVRDLFKEEVKNGKFSKVKNNRRNIEQATFEKIGNIDKVKSLANSYGVKVGVGDNDLHYLSQSRCCCGVDTINENFDNYMKYNSTYLSTGEYDLNSIWIPKESCYDCFFSSVSHQDKELYSSVKRCVEDYIRKYPEQLGNKKNKIEKDLFGVTKKKLF